MRYKIFEATTGQPIGRCDDIVTAVTIMQTAGPGETFGIKDEHSGYVL